MIVAVLLGIVFVLTLPGYSQVQKTDRALDEKVKAFLDKMKNRWHDWNVPVEDGKILYNLVLRNQYKRALELVHRPGTRPSGLRGP